MAGCFGKQKILAKTDRGQHVAALNYRSRFALHPQTNFQK
jgi:hypothetical protein